MGSADNIAAAILLERMKARSVDANRHCFSDSSRAYLIAETVVGIGPDIALAVEMKTSEIAVIVHSLGMVSVHPTSWPIKIHAFADVQGT
jgi:hypothetical protein